MAQPSKQTKGKTPPVKGKPAPKNGKPTHAAQEEDTSNAEETASLAVEEDEAAAIEPPSEGWHLVRCTGVKSRTTSTDKPQVQISLTVEDGDEAGKNFNLFQMMPYPGEKEGAKFFRQRIAEAFGITEKDEDTGKLKYDFSALPDHLARVKLGHEANPNNGRLQAKAQDWAPAEA